MTALVNAALLILLSLLAMYLVARRRRQQLLLIRAKSQGCKPAQKQYQELPFGIDHLIRNFKADRDKRFPEMLVERQTLLGRNHTIEINVLGSKSYYTVDPLNVQALLATQFNDFVLGQTRNGNFSPLLGNGIFTQDGDAWKHSRAMLRPHFARAQIEELGWLEKYTTALMNSIRGQSEGKPAAVDLQPLFSRLTLDAALEFLFGDLGAPTAVDSFEISDARKEDFAAAFDRAQSIISTRLRFQEIYWMYSPPGFHASCQRVHQFVERIVHRALATENHATSAPDESRHTLLAALMQETSNPTELRDQLLNILLAGRDATASLLSWLFHALSHDPSRYTSLRAAVLASFGTTTHPLAPLTLQSLKSCLPLTHALSETLRLYPPVPINVRFAAHDTTLPRGGGADGASPVFVPSGCEVAYSVHAMQRRRDIWGEDAEEWKPERWGQGGVKVGWWEYLPFNGGPRICLGQQFALAEAGFVVVRLLQRFEGVEGVGEVGGRVRYELGVTDRPADGVVCVLREARGG